MKYRKWLGLLALIPGTGMVFTDQAVLPVALPVIQQHLGASATELWWCVNSYLLVSAVLVLAGGKLGDRMGYRKAFSWGMVLFALASLLCGLSMNVVWLIGARAFQGVGAALMIPAMSPLIMSLFSPKERGRAIGLNVSVSSLFLIFAPMIGGYFTEALSWRWIFWINLPLAVVGSVMLPLFISRSEKKLQGFDVRGFVFFAVMASSLVILIMQGGAWGWMSLKSAGFGALFTAGALLLFLREKQALHPFVDISLVRHSVYTAVNLSIFVTQFVLTITVYRAVFFQNVLGWSPMQSGTILFITSIPVLFMSAAGGFLADRFGPKVPLAIGFTALIYSFFWTGFFIESGLLVLLLGLFAFSFGISLIFTPSYSSAMGAVPPTKSGHAFGVLATVRAMSATLGIAIISALVHHAQTYFFQALLQQDPTTEFLDANALGHQLTGGKSVGGETVLRYWREAQTDAFRMIHVILGLMLTAVFALVFVLYRRRASHEMPKAPAEGWD